MFILQTLKEYIDNPMGKGSTAIPGRQLIKDDLTRRYENIIEHENDQKENKIKLNIYRDGDEYYFHFIIPSESKRRNTYDVVLHFVLDEEGTMRNDNNLNRYLLKFFSNCPSFTYTFAYAFNLYGLLIENLENKFRKEVLERIPIQRNPAEIISYEKTIFFACIHLLRNPKYLNKIVINSLSKPYSQAEFNKRIRNTDQIELEIKKEKRRLEVEDAQEKLSTKRTDTKKEKASVSLREEKKLKRKNKRDSKGKIIPHSKITPRKSSIAKRTPR